MIENNERKEYGKEKHVRDGIENLTLVQGVIVSEIVDHVSLISDIIHIKLKLIILMSNTPYVLVGHLKKLSIVEF